MREVERKKERNKETKDVRGRQSEKERDREKGQKDWKR